MQKIDASKVNPETKIALRLIKSLTFLQLIAQKPLNTQTSSGLNKPLSKAAKYIIDSKKWYAFLNELYVKLSSFEVQKYKTFYLSQILPSGLILTQNGFGKFLENNIINQFGLAGYNSTTGATYLQVLELGEV